QDETQDPRREEEQPPRALPPRQGSPPTNDHGRSTAEGGMLLHLGPTHGSPELVEWSKDERATAAFHRKVRVAGTGAPLSDRRRCSATSPGGSSLPGRYPGQASCS